MMRSALPCLVTLLLSTAPAGSEQPPAPARMIACEVIPETIERRGTAPPETIRVSFMITGDAPADLVRFTATSPSGELREFSAHGAFTKSIMIAGRVLPVDPAAPVHALAHGVECSLTYIHYVDGRSWSAPSP
ncbi:MAG: hypothetical protein WA814_07310 [Candidatus Baltobacteraceae bacterium]